MKPFEVGQKVVCIDDKFPQWILPLYTALPKEGVVYVIRDVRLGVRPDCRTGDISLLLVGLVNPRSDSRPAHERGFSQERFRHLEEMKSQAAEPQTEGAEYTKCARVVEEAVK